MTHLSAEELSIYQAFCRKHHVKVHDVQLALIQILNLKVKDIQLKQPQLSLTEALQQVYESYGVMGFTYEVREIEKRFSVNEEKNYWKLFFQYVFNAKTCLFAIVYIASVYVVTLLTEANSTQIMLLLLSLLLVAIQLYFNSKLTKATAIPKQFLSSYKANSSYFFSPSIILLLLQVGYRTASPNPLITVLISLVLLLLFLGYYAFYQSQIQLYRHARQQYPEVFQ